MTQTDNTQDEKTGSPLLASYAVATGAQDSTRNDQEISSEEDDFEISAAGGGLTVSYNGKSITIGDRDSNEDFQDLISEGLRKLGVSSSLLSKFAIPAAPVSALLAEVAPTAVISHAPRITGRSLKAMLQIADQATTPLERTSALVKDKPTAADALQRRQDSERNSEFAITFDL